MPKKAVSLKCCICFLIFLLK
ncbi:hypothetical protein AAZV13_20G048200 [Glycine max]